MLKSNFCYHILLFKIFVEIDSKSIQVCNLLIINGSSEMTPEIQTILNLLCGSAVCCKEEVTPVDGHVGDHVVSVTHPDGRVTSVIVSVDFLLDGIRGLSGKKFSELGLNFYSCDFPQI